MKNRIVYQIDSFTKEKFKGNPAGVVVNAEGLNDYQMQQIARELNNSETAFLFPPDSDDCDGTIRYFTPSTKSQFADMLQSLRCMQKQSKII